MEPLRQFGGAPTSVVIAGGGVGGIECLLALRALAGERVSIDLVEPGREFVYRPLSVLEPFDGGATPRFDLAKIALDQGVRHQSDTVAAVDVDRRRVRLGSGGELRYDVFVQATGARPLEAIEGALTFTGPEDRDRMATILLKAERGLVRKIVFAVPPGIVWTLPLYELALNTAAYLSARVRNEVELVLVTPEDSPLSLFGPHPSEVVQRLLEERSIELKTSTYPVAFEEGVVNLIPPGHIEADHVVALPVLEGLSIPGLPHDDHGFIATDEHCLVRGLTDVYAIGDATTFPIKQGGIAAEMADAAAEAIASRAGAPVGPMPFRPVLRGLMLTGGKPRYLSARITRGPAIESQEDVEPLWWPPSKIPGHYMALYLGERGKMLARSGPSPDAVLPIEADLSTAALPSVRTGPRDGA